MLLYQATTPISVTPDPELPSKLMSAFISWTTARTTLDCFVRFNLFVVGSSEIKKRTHIQAHCLHGLLMQSDGHLVVVTSYWLPLAHPASPNWNSGISISIQKIRVNEMVKALRMIGAPASSSLGVLIITG